MLHHVMRFQYYTLTLLAIYFVFSISLSLSPLPLPTQNKVSKSLEELVCHSSSIPEGLLPPRLALLLQDYH